MGKNKHKKFTDLDSFSNVYQNFNPMDPKLQTANGEIIDRKGDWAKGHFKNDNPIVLELACGMGHYAVALARKYPNKNFIGIDIKGARIWQGAKIGLDENLPNLAFLRTRIEQIELFFDKNEIDEIWITFPDPFLRKSRSNKRLTSPPFLNRYRNIIKKGALIQLKTDSQELYLFTDETLREDEKVKILYQNPDIYSKTLDFEELEIKTYYEKKHLANGLKITYTRFTIDN